MVPINTYNVFELQTALHSVQVVKIEGLANAASAANGYIQVFDSNTTPANGAVPKKEWYVTTGGEFFKTFEGNPLSLSQGCYICFSTTSGTKTLGTGNNKLASLSVELTNADQPAGTSFAGDLTTSVTGLDVWANSAGPKQLIALEVNGTGLGDASFIQVFATDSPTNGDVPVSSYPIGSEEVLTGSQALRFGNDGFSPIKVVQGVVYAACRIRISSTPFVLTLTLDTATIKAEYK